MNIEKIELILNTGSKYITNNEKAHILDYIEYLKNKNNIVESKNIELVIEIERLNNIINETRRILGEYKHYSTPDEIQNMFNEEIVDRAYIKLHNNLQELKGSDKE